ncbi:MAG: CMP-binding protein [Planctomycetes bacterium RBG_16_64_10]|nr:MAG: CMP-binding protein [Planctomycetes bacterium RBG_16_64_10]
MAASTRRFVTQLKHQENVDQVFLASDKQLRPNRNGNYYLQLELKDRSGSIDARLWNASEQDYRCFNNGDYVHVEGSTQLFQGKVQIIASRIRKAELAEVEEEDFRTVDQGQVDEWADRLTTMLRQIKALPLRNLAECFLMDESFMQKLVQAPAATKNHHAYQGGLLEHTVGVMELVQLTAGRYPQLDSELLLMGAFLHDLGKVDELDYERDIAYSDAGQLLGHIVMAMEMVDEKVREAERLAGEPFPRELVVEIKHMIASHHGQYEFGSPKLPMTLEAVALHHLDNLDAKIHCFQQLMRDDANVDSRWTQYHANLGRKLFKKD